jgi:hypothetical protein
VFLQRIGAWQAARQEEHEELRQLVAQRGQANAIVDKAVGMIRKMAARPESNGTISKDFMAVIIPSDTSRPMRAVLKRFGAPDKHWLLK